MGLRPFLCPGVPRVASEVEAAVAALREHEHEQRELRQQGLQREREQADWPLTPLGLGQEANEDPES